MKIRWMQLVMVAGLMAVGLVGCGGGGNTTDLPDPQVRFINGTPDAVGLDFLMNDSITAANVAYLSSSPGFQFVDYIEPSDDGYDIGARRNGQATDLDRIAVDLQRDTSQLVVTLGLQDPLSEPQKRLRLINFQILRTTPTGSRSRILFINGFLRGAGFETPNVTFQSVVPGDPSSIDNPQDVSRDIAYADIRTLTVDAGARRFIVRRADTDALVQYASQDVTLVAGRLYVALMTGQEANANPALQPKIQFIEIETQD